MPTNQGDDDRRPPEAKRNERHATWRAIIGPVLRECGKRAFDRSYYQNNNKSEKSKGRADQLLRAAPGTASSAYDAGDAALNAGAIFCGPDALRAAGYRADVVAHVGTFFRRWTLSGMEALSKTTQSQLVDALIELVKSNLTAIIDTVTSPSPIGRLAHDNPKIAEALNDSWAIWSDEKHQLRVVKQTRTYEPCTGSDPRSLWPPYGAAYLLLKDGAYDGPTLGLAKMNLTANNFNFGWQRVQMLEFDIKDGEIVDGGRYIGEADIFGRVPTWDPSYKTYRGSFERAHNSMTNDELERLYRGPNVAASLPPLSSREADEISHLLRGLDNLNPES